MQFIFNFETCYLLSVINCFIFNLFSKHVVDINLSYDRTPNLPKHLHVKNILVLKTNLQETKMGSSKKKHKKNKEKDKDKEREKCKSKSSSHLGTNESKRTNYNSMGNNDTAPLYSVEKSQENHCKDQEESTGQESTVLKPLRLVLKVPPAYSQTKIPISSASASAISEPTSVQSYSDPHQDALPTVSPPYLDPLKTAFPIDQHSDTSPADISSTKMSSTTVFNSRLPTNMSTSDDGGLVNSKESSVSSLHYINSLFSASSNKLLSKKVKKSKKSKKSKHRKHSHSHSHKHSHRKHHHHISPILPADNNTVASLTCAYDSKQQLEDKTSLTDQLNSLPPPTLDHNIIAASNDTPSNINRSPFGDNVPSFTATSDPLANFSTQQHFQNIESKPLNEPEPKSNWQFSTTKTTFTSTKTTTSSNDSTTQQSYYLSSSSNVSMSQKTGSEIKLTLSKASSSTQYSSNLKHSPNKLSSTAVLPQIVPPLIISPSKTSSPFVGKSSQQTNSVDSAESNFQINSKMSSITTTSVSTAFVSEPKISSLVKPLVKISKFKSGEHKNSKKFKSEKKFQDLLLHLHRQLTKRDSQGFFAKPVSDLIAPGYSSIIVYPMDLSTIGKNITTGHYRNLGDFKADVKLMCDNAMKYNRVETIYYKSANKLWHYTKNKLFKNSSLAEYAKIYVKCTPMDLSLNPTNPPPNCKHLSSTNSFFNITPFNTESTTCTSATFSSTNMLKSSPKSFEPANTLPVGFGGIVPMTSSTPFKLDPEPSSAVSLEVATPAQNQALLPGNYDQYITYINNLIRLII